MVTSDASTAKHELHDIATHAHNLAIGLQNVAPPQTTAGSSAQYLKEIAIELEKISKQIKTSS